MNKITVTVGTATYAIKLKKLLSRGNIRSKLVKVEDIKNHRGCVHGVEINNQDFLKSVVILKENGMEYSVYNAENL